MAHLEGECDHHSYAPQTPQTPQQPTIDPAACDGPSIPDALESPFRKSRYDHFTRRECLEKKFGRQRTPTQDYESFSFRRRPDEEKKSDHDYHHEEDVRRQPQHLTPSSSEEVHYYRVVYRGVVALLSRPEPSAPRSGCYLSYGEVIQSGCPIRGPDGEVIAIRVDRVLTGGYAYDPSVVTEHSETPKRSNVERGYTTTAAECESPATPTVSIALAQSTEDEQHPPLDLSSPALQCREDGGVCHQGYVWTQNKKNVPIVQVLKQPPHCEHGSFFYKVVSTTPLPILSGPSADAPVSKAMVLPGTVHEVSFRIFFGNTSSEGVWFLRLAKRKGYIASQRRLQSRRQSGPSEPLVKDVTDDIHSNNLPNSSCVADEDAATNVSVLSALSTSIPSSTARHPRRRHRPPRRTRETSRPSRKQQDTTIVQNLSVQSHSSDRLQMTPSSNVSLLSDDSGLMEHHHNHNSSLERSTLSPDRSMARSLHPPVQQQLQPQHPTFFLMRVTTRQGLRILDAPHFQVNNLIHGNHPHQPDLFHAIGGTTGAETMRFDAVSKTRILPHKAVFEACKRMETADALFHQGAGLIKLADNSGWVIVPHPEELMPEGNNMRGYEEIGNAICFQDPKNSNSSTSWVDMRVVARGGVQVVCAPPAPVTEDPSPNSQSSSPANSSVGQQLALGKSDSKSDVASSVGSSFLDAMFRGQKRSDISDDHHSKKSAVDKPPPPSTVISCGTCVQVEPQIPPDHPQHRSAPQEFTRLRGGQGWMPLFLGGKPACVVCPRRNPPESRFGSFWFRVQSKRGIKVRLGPSKRAPSIKSGDGVYFRFECGEFLRASEVMTVYYEDRQGRILTESFAKLYRNRHVKVREGGTDYRKLASYTTQAEWVQIHDDDKNEQFLQESSANGPPRIERHKQGWRYKVVAGAGIPIKKGPSFDAEDSGLHIAEGESVAIIERVTCPSENGVTWLRLKEGQGWLHDLDRETGEKLIIPHSFRHRTKATNTRPSKPNRPRGASDDKNQKIAYNTIIARLFNNDLPSDHIPRPPSCQAEDFTR